MIKTEVLHSQPFIVRHSHFVYIAESTLKQCKRGHQLCSNDEVGEGVCMNGVECNSPISAVTLFLNCCEVGTSASLCSGIIL